jgi:UDP-2,4-diacetamido-2,4,6-trideoxy-beta-L-altropyranose hydrolase
MNLLIRADASAVIGSGHVMRCLALAQAWQDQGSHTIFAMAMEAPALEARLKSEGVELLNLLTRLGSLEDARQIIALAKKVQAIWIVVDGYHFGAEYQRCIKESGLKLLVIDDFGHLESYNADLVLNQDLCAEEILYRNRASFTRLLLGPRYALIRHEFSKWREWNREISDVGRKVLVTMGGGDPDNVTFKVIQSLQQVDVDGLEAVVVVGATNTHYEELKSAVRSSHVPIRLEQNVTSMPELMGWADVAVSAGGSTCWELSLMGLPALILLLADNQRENTRLLHMVDAVISLGWHREVACERIASALEGLCEEKDQRVKMSSVGRGLVDGKGAARVVGLMMDRGVE